MCSLDELSSSMTVWVWVQEYDCITSLDEYDDLNIITEYWESRLDSVLLLHFYLSLIQYSRYNNNNNNDHRNQTTAETRTDFSVNIWASACWLWTVCRFNTINYLKFYKMLAVALPFGPETNVQMFECALHVCLMHKVWKIKISDLHPLLYCNKHVVICYWNMVTQWCYFRIAWPAFRVLCLTKGSTTVSRWGCHCIYCPTARTESRPRPLHYEMKYLY